MLWPYLAELLFTSKESRKSADFRLSIFTGKSRGGQRHLVAPAPYGSVRAAENAQAYPHGSSRKRLKIGGTQKILSRSGLDFLYRAFLLWGLKGASSPFFMDPAR